jgi:hypothetical protein
MVAPIVAAAAGGLVALITRAAASTVVRHVVVGTAVWWGGNYVARAGLKEAEKTATVAGAVAGTMTQTAEDAFLVTVRRMALPAIAGYVIYSAMQPPGRR